MDKNETQILQRDDLWDDSTLRDLDEPRPDPRDAKETKGGGYSPLLYCF